MSSEEESQEELEDLIMEIEKQTNFFLTETGGPSRLTQAYEGHHQNE